MINRWRFNIYIIAISEEERKENEQIQKSLIKENFPEIKQLEKDLKLHIERAQHFSENTDKNIYWLSK